MQRLTCCLCIICFKFVDFEKKPHLVFITLVVDLGSHYSADKALKPELGSFMSMEVSANGVIRITLSTLSPKY